MWVTFEMIRGVLKWSSKRECAQKSLKLEFQKNMEIILIGDTQPL